MKAIWGTLGVCASIALIAFTYFMLVLSFQTRTNGKHAAELLMNYSETSVKINKTLDEINGKKGTLSQVNDAIRDIRLTVAHSDRLMTKQEKSIDQWNSQITATLGNVNTSVQALTDNENKITKQTGEVLTATTESVKSVKPLVDNLTAEAKDLQTTTAALNAMVPDIQATAKNANHVTSNLSSMSDDAKYAFHKWVYPGPLEKVWGFVSGVGLDLGKFFLP